MPEAAISGSTTPKPAAWCSQARRTARSPLRRSLASSDRKPIVPSQGPITKRPAIVLLTLSRVRSQPGIRSCRQSAW